MNVEILMQQHVNHLDSYSLFSCIFLLRNEENPQRLGFKSILIYSVVRQIFSHKLM